jgi:pre-mRNA-processing factor 40
LKAKEQEEKEARLSKLRPALRNMLKGNPSVFHYTTFATANKHFSQHPIWQQAKIEAERKLIFEEYIEELTLREMVCPILSRLNTEYDNASVFLSTRVVQLVQEVQPKLLRSLRSLTSMSSHAGERHMH